MTCHSTLAIEHVESQRMHRNTHFVTQNKENSEAEALNSSYRHIPQLEREHFFLTPYLSFLTQTRRSLYALLMPRQVDSRLLCLVERLNRE